MTGTGTHFLVVQRWNGSGWQAVPRGSPGYYLANAVTDGNGGWWAEPYGQPGPAYFLHFSGGHWAKVQVSLPGGDGLSIFDFVHVPGTTSMLAAGWESVPWKNGKGTAFDAVVLAYGPR